METIDLNKLPPLDVVKQLSHAEIVKAIVADAGLENASPADPAYRVALAAAYREQLVRKDANEQAQGLFLAFARGPQLDHIGATYYRQSDGSGLARLAGESDDDYRDRAQQSPEGLSVAGPDGAYKFHAMSADPRVKQVYVLSPSPVSIEVYVLSRESTGVPGADLLKKVDDLLSSGVRPLTDEVKVFPAVADLYQVEAVLKIKNGPDPEIVRQKSAEAGRLYVDKKHQFKGRVVESGLYAALTVEGVEEVSLIGWTDKIATEKSAPYCDAFTVTIGEIL